MENTDHQKEGQRSPDTTRSRQELETLGRGGYEPLGFSPLEFLSNPFSAMRRFQEDIDRVLSEAFGSRSTSSGFSSATGSWAPAIEVSERDNQMVVCAELPGLKPEDVKVEITEEAIVIEGERRHEHEEKQEGRWHSERSYGRFSRTIPLPEGANADQARADFKNGELQVTIPVERPQSKRRQIPIGGTAPERKGVERQT